MRNTWIAAVAMVALVPAMAGAQDAKTVIANASKAMGADGVNSIVVYGSGANYGLGQSNNANGEWPRTNLNDYVRAIDFTASTVRGHGVTWAAPVTAPVAVQGQFQQNITAAQANAWAQQLEIWTTPWGSSRVPPPTTPPPRRRRSVASATGAHVDDHAEVAGRPAYRVVGYISPRGLVDRVETWLGDPIFGDMLVEQIYTEYRDANGVMYPAKWVQNAAGSRRSICRRSAFAPTRTTSRRS
jgi:hypothetical protein